MTEGSCVPVCRHSTAAEAVKEHASKRFKEISEAYDVLADATKKSVYDRQVSLIRVAGLLMHISSAEQEEHLSTSFIHLLLVLPVGTGGLESSTQLWCRRALSTFIRTRVS